MILGGKPPGKVGRRRNLYHKGESLCDRYSSLAQLAEHAAVNRVVVGSSPTGGAKKKTEYQKVLCFSFCFFPPVVLSLTTTLVNSHTLCQLSVAKLVVCKTFAACGRWRRYCRNAVAEGLSGYLLPVKKLRCYKVSFPPQRPIKLKWQSLNCSSPLMAHQKETTIFDTKVVVSFCAFLFSLFSLHYSLKIVVSR